MAKKGLISVVDIGGSKAVCMIAALDVEGNITITGIGHQVADGVRAGVIVDIKKAERAVLAAVNAAEKMAGETIDDVYVNVSGNTLSSHIINVTSSISGHEVTQKDIDFILNEAKAQFADEHHRILNCLPIHFTIDDMGHIQDPCGMYGEQLSTELHVITASATATKNIANCLARCHLKVNEYITSPYAASLACLTEDEKELGCILVDMGASTTSYAIFVGGAMIHTDSITVGGNAITSDIAKVLSTNLADAERMKTLYGSVVATAQDEREVIEVESNHASRNEYTVDSLVQEGHISKALLSQIIRPRALETLQLLRENIEQSGFWAKAGSRIVLTGGASQMQGMKELANHCFSRHTRIAKPTVVDGLADAAQSPAFTAAVGMVLHAAQDLKRHKGGQFGRRGRKSAGFMGWLKENF